MSTYAQRVKSQGGTYHVAAELLGVPARTLRSWRARAPIGAPLGRRPKRSSLEARSAVLATLTEYGPGLGLEPLHAEHPHLPRREVRDILARTRSVYRRRGTVVQELEWLAGGTVWATDTTEVSGTQSSTALLLTDLASKAHLDWTQIAAKNGPEVAARLTCAIRTLGAPLVIKHDNGAEFVNEDVQAVAQAAKIVVLRSPARTPRFNGSCEASIRGLKRRTTWIADREGHEAWTQGDFNCARLSRNAIVRPHGRRGPTPEHAWQLRSSVTTEQRGAFLAEVENQKDQLRVELDADAQVLGKNELLRLERRAVVRALVRFGLVNVKRRRIRPPITTIRAARDS